MRKQDTRQRKDRGQQSQQDGSQDRGQSGQAAPEAAQEGRQQGDANRQPGQAGSGQNVYGEGNYAASKQYNDATRDFARSGRVEEAAREAAPRSDADALQMQAAEAEGKRHAKGEDPALNRKRSNLAPDTPRAPKPGEEE